MPGTEVELAGSRRRRSGRGPDDRRALGETILAARNKGQKMYAICADLGISEPTGYEWMKLALNARIAPTVDEYRRQQNDALDERAAMLQQQIDACDAMLTDPVDPPTKSMLLAIMAERRQTVIGLAKIDERRAKLNGLDAPVRTDVTLTVHDNEDAELAEMLAEARAAQANAVQP